MKSGTAPSTFQEFLALSIEELEAIDRDTLDKTGKSFHTRALKSKTKQTHTSARKS
jgi:hypothetical protein